MECAVIFTYTFAEISLGYVSAPISAAPGTHQDQGHKRKKFYAHRAPPSYPSPGGTSFPRVSDEAVDNSYPYDPFRLLADQKTFGSIPRPNDLYKSRGF